MVVNHRFFIASAYRWKNTFSFLPPLIGGRTPFHAPGESRTHTSLRTLDFESSASASSATSALNNYINNKVNVIIFGLFNAVSGYKRTLCCLRQCYLVVLYRYHTVPTSQNCLMVTRRARD